MKKKYQRDFTLAAALGLLFLIYTLALSRIDVQPIGPRGSCVGFAAFNQWVAQRVGFNWLLYHITDWLGVAAIAVAFGFAVLGLVQLIRRRHLLRVDHSILVLGGFYLLVIAAYVFFEYNIINYRPVLVENVLEASYPSSTTMLLMCVMPTAMMQFQRLIRRRHLRLAVNSACAALTVFTVCGRVLSGVHWATDILGGALLSAALIMLYTTVIQYWDGKEQ